MLPCICTWPHTVKHLDKTDYSLILKTLMGMAKELLVIIAIKQWTEQNVKS